MDEPLIKDALKNDGCPKNIGGQAVIEGVMMRGKNMYAMAVRNPAKEIEIVTKDLTPISKKFPFLKYPIIRGIVAFVDSLVLGIKLTTKSAELAGMDDDTEEPGKFELWLEKVFGDKLMNVLLYASVAVALLFSVVLFALLPTWLAGFISGNFAVPTWSISVIEGTIRITILVGYMLLISRSKDIQRVFQYHGAEHKTINCFEHNEALTVENVKKHTRLHKRCGTSFLIIVMMLSIFVFLFVQTRNVWLRFGLHFLLIPFIAGLSYECIRWAGRSNSALINIISYPGLWLQKVTTAEPDDEQIAVAIAAMSEVLRNETPDEPVTCP